MTYVHNGSEIHTDSFQLTVSDGIQNSSVIMRINMEPVDDERPVVTGSDIVVVIVVIIVVVVVVVAPPSRTS